MLGFDCKNAVFGIYDVVFKSLYTQINERAVVCDCILARIFGRADLVAVRVVILVRYAEQVVILIGERV